MYETRVIKIESSIISSLLSDFCFLFWFFVICRLSSVFCFYAKQTQFTNCPNELNLFINNELCNFYQSGSSQNQTQFKPNSNPIKANQSQNKPNSNPIAQRPKMNANIYDTKVYSNKTVFRRKINKAKQTQFKPNFEGFTGLDNNLRKCYISCSKFLYGQIVKIGKRVI